jgi:hypothetical protein
MDVLHCRYTKHQVEPFALEATLFYVAYFINDRWMLKGVANIIRLIQPTDHRTSFDEGSAIFTGSAPDDQHWSAADGTCVREALTSELRAVIVHPILSILFSSFNRSQRRRQEKGITGNRSEPVAFPVALQQGWQKWKNESLGRQSSLQNDPFALLFEKPGDGFADRFPQPRSVVLGRLKIKNSTGY